MKKDVRYFFLFTILLYINISEAFADRRNENILEKTCNSFLRVILNYVDIGSPIIIESVMDNTKSTIGEEISNITDRLLNESVIKEKKLILVERKNIEQVLSQIEFKLSGIFDQNKTNAVYELIGAKYIIYTTITNETDGFRIQIRLVDLSSAKIIYEDGCTIAVGGAKQIIKVYTPPEYRFTICAYRYNYLQTRTNYFGGEVGIGYFITKYDEILLAVYGGYNSNSVEPLWLIAEEDGPYFDSSVSGGLNAGYGRCINIGPFLIIRPQLSIGFDVDTGLIVYDADGYNQQETIKPKFTGNILFGTSMIFSNDSPLGFYISVGMRRYLPSLKLEFSHSPYLDITQEWDWGLLTTAGIQFHL